MKTLIESLKHSLLMGAGGCLLLLALQNLIIFWHHYVGTDSFVRDFSSIYYPMTAFWTTLVAHGIFPEWLPFENMGFPFVLTMQSGIFYPPLWLFTLSEHLPYTLHTAGILQGLHVGFGAVGCWLYARLLGRSLVAALFAAVAFQFFGGFYSNSEHVDIVRAFAYIPWLFWAVQVLPAQETMSRRQLWLPLIVMLFVTGAYQGNVIAHFFILGFFILLSFVANYFQLNNTGNLMPKNRIVKNYLQMVGLILLGLGLSAVCLFPTLALKSYLLRSEVWVGRTMNWSLSSWNSLVMPSTAEGLYVMRSMVSAFITVPVFCLLFFASLALVKRCGVWIGVSALSFAMAGGVYNVVCAWLVSVFPFLGYSRFPASDYRGLLAFGLILVAAAILDDYRQQKINWKFTRILIYIFLVAFMFFSGNYISVEAFEWLIMIGLSILVFATLRVFEKQRNKAVLILIVLELISGLYFLRQSSVMWRANITSDVFYVAVSQTSPRSVLEVIDHPAAARPACTEFNFFVDAWRGYLSGEYSCESHDSKTKLREIVYANPVIDAYMRQPWQARIIQKEALVTCQPEKTIQENSVASPIHSVSFGLQQIAYQVKASEDFCFVENEMQFSGWSGAITGSTQSFQPQAYCGALRSWCLPKGSYQFTETYHTPWLRTGAIASVFFLICYFVLCVAWFRLSRKAT